MTNPRSKSPLSEGDMAALNDPEVVTQFLNYAIVFGRRDPKEIGDARKLLKDAIVEAGVTAKIADWFIDRKTEDVRRAQGQTH